MKKLAIAASVTLAAVSTSASAAPQSTFPNWYIGLGAGVTDQDSSEFKTPGAKTSRDWDAGYLLKASIGYQPSYFGGFRVEGEYTNHHENTSSNNSFDTNVNVGAVNLYYDFFNSSVITPYIGGGLGYADFHLGGVSGDRNDSDTAKAIYQGIVGLSWQPNSVPDVAFDLNYRYFAPFGDVKVDDTKFQYDNHSVELGARFKF